MVPGIVLHQGREAGVLPLGPPPEPDDSPTLGQSQLPGHRPHILDRDPQLPRQSGVCDAREVAAALSVENLSAVHFAFLRTERNGVTAASPGDVPSRRLTEGELCEPRHDPRRPVFCPLAALRKRDTDYQENKCRLTPSFHRPA